MSKRRSNRTVIEDDSDDPVFERAVTECVRFIICREGNKVPIKRAEITKHLASTCETAVNNKISTIMVEANKKLKQVYGYKLVQVEAKSSIQYIVVLDEECESLPATITDSKQRQLLIAALMHIYMTGLPVKEDDMWQFLSEAGLMVETDNAVRKLLTHTFTSQMYLSYTKVGEGDYAKNVFQWGQRAIEEVPKMFLLNKMAQAFDKPPEHWREQYKEARTETEET